MVDIVVLTTAALPWRTGPAVFSLWHAGGLAALGYRVAYGVPWLSAGSQKRLWGEVLFPSQDAYRAWLHEEAQRLGAPPLPEIFFYKGIFFRSLFSVFPAEDPFAAAPHARFVLTQEPEHLGWLPWSRSKRQIGADKSIGIVMTNYGSYIRRPGQPHRAAFASFLEWCHKKLMRKHADIIVPLSPALDLSGVEDLVEWRQVTGVLSAFAKVPPVADDCHGVYFLGRLTWDKGLAWVIDMALRLGNPIDVYGEGPDQQAITQAAVQQQAPVRFLGGSASPWEVMAKYRVFFNPSLSEVLCSTTAEALVAGRHVVLPRCLANQPFYDLPNVHVYDSLDQAEQMIRHARTAAVEPPLKARERFDWQAVCRSVAEFFERENPKTPLP